MKWAANSEQFFSYAFIFCAETLIFVVFLNFADLQQGKSYELMLVRTFLCPSVCMFVTNFSWNLFISFL